MPIYEYVCQDCGEKYEKLVRSSVVKVEVICPTCGSDRAEKALSMFGAPGSTTKSNSVVNKLQASASSCGPVG
jgi:putative FmdB family regulatory protein